MRGRVRYPPCGSSSSCSSSSIGSDDDDDDDDDETGRHDRRLSTLERVADSAGQASLRVWRMTKNLADGLRTSNLSEQLCKKQGCKVTVMCIVPIVLGVVVLHFTEGWTILTSLYVITQVMTTIGYGDVAINNPATRLFMVAYVLWCLVLLAFALSFWFASLLDSTENRLRERLRDFEAWQTEQQMDEVKRRWKALNGVLANGLIFGLHVLFGVLFFGFVDRTPNDCQLGDIGECDDECILHWYGTCNEAVHHFPGYAEALYMSVITLTTVGFGDFTPKSKLGRLVGIFWMSSGVLATGKFIASMQDLIFEAMQDKDVHIVPEDIEKEDFKKMEEQFHGATDGWVNDGWVTRGEFQTYMLKKYNLVPTDIIDHINDVYSRLEGISRVRLGDALAENKVHYDDVLTFRYQNSQLRSRS